MISVLPGEACPESGIWFTNYLEKSQKWFEAGEIMPGPKYNHMGMIIWYWLSDDRQLLE